MKHIFMKKYYQNADRIKESTKNNKELNFVSPFDKFINNNTQNLQKFKEQYLTKPDHKMNDENETEQKIPEKRIIEIIEEFVGCLNYPNTQAALIKQKNVRSMMNQDKVEAVVEGNVEDHGMEEEKIIEQIGQQEKVQSCSIMKVQEKQEQNNEKPQQFTWRLQEAKYYSKIATFSQILSLLEKSVQQRELTAKSLRQMQLINTNNEILEQSINSKPTLLHLFSAFDTISRVKQFTVPIYRNLSVQQKFAKHPRLMQSSSKQNLLCLIDSSSTPFIVNLQQRTLIQVPKQKQLEQVTSIRWLNSGNVLVMGLCSGKLLVFTVTQGKTMDKTGSVQAHLGEIVCMYCNKDYLYTCSNDYTISKIHIRHWKVELSLKLRTNWFKKIVKIQNRKLKNVIIGIDVEGSQLVMIDQSTGFSTVLFSIKKQHLAQCRKIYEKRQQKIKASHIARNSFISDIIVNTENDSLIVSVSGINPSIYEVDPLRNQSILHLNYKNLKCPFNPPPASQEIENFTTNQNQNIHMSLTHRAEILVITNNSNSIFYVRVKNWRILHQHVDDKAMSFGMITSTRRYTEVDDSLLINRITGKQPTNSNLNEIPQRQPIICVQNIHNGNIEIYYNYKNDLKTLRTDPARSRTFLTTGLGSHGFPSSAQGFLDLLQTIRENYQAFV